MLLSRAAFLRVGRALSTRVMPLPSEVPPNERWNTIRSHNRSAQNDVHLVRWAEELGIEMVHTTLFSPSPVPPGFLPQTNTSLFKLGGLLVGVGPARGGLITMHRLPGAAARSTLDTLAARRSRTATGGDSSARPRGSEPLKS